MTIVIADPLRDDGLLLEKALRPAGVDVERRLFLYRAIDARQMNDHRPL